MPRLRPSSRVRGVLPRIIRATTGGATVCALLLWGLLAWTNDANPAGMLLGFAPLWWCVVPWVLLLPASAMAGVRWVAVAAVGTLVSLFGVAQFQWAARGPAGAQRDIRVVTYNTDLSVSLAMRLRDDIRRWDADIILLQDCKTIVADSLRSILRNTVVYDRHCVASRWPLLDVTDVAQLLSPADPSLRQDRNAVRVRVRTPFGVLPVYSVHLPSPRDALGAARWLDLSSLMPRLRRSLAQRGNASAAVAATVPRGTSAFIVAGDFNAPYGSAILRRDWGHLTNAFANAGRGFGYTMQAGIFPVRIDHVFVPESLVPLTATVQSGYPSEHQPVMVDLWWRG